MIEMKFLFLIVLLCVFNSFNDVLAFKSLRLLRLTREFFNDTDPHRLGGSFHECYRKCEKGQTKTCRYNFTVSEYVSMSSVCGNCPTNEKDCYNQGCVIGGGHMRPVIVANLMLPGPSIQVCEGDRVIVHVDNIITSKAISLHWHGVWQKETPYMDGTPYLTQCPILPHNSFKYDFRAFPAGTNIWHSHVGFEEADGLHGSLIIREAADPLAKYYDYDLAEHVIIIWHWYPVPSSYLMGRAMYANKPKEGYSFLINGLSRKNVGQTNGTLPMAIFHVHEGKRYRFRTLLNTALYCPVQVSIDNHKLLMISSETSNFEPIEVDSFMLNAGERYDFVLTADQEPRNYLIRFRGVGICESFEISETAILRYNNIIPKEPISNVSYEASRRTGVLLNPVEEATTNYTHNTLIRVVDLNNAYPVPHKLSGKPDHKIYLTLAFKKYDNIVTTSSYPQINDLTFDFPPVSLLTQYDEVTPDMYCTPSNDSSKQCIGKFCTCPMVYPVAKDSLVEIIFIDTTTGVGVNHPMHLHGYQFYVVAEESVGVKISADRIRRWNEAGVIKKKFVKPPGKDTVSVQSQGYTIVRFIADNPGYWFLHCHVSDHAEMGMGVVIKVGEHHEMVHPPPSFPRCGNWNLE